MRCPSLSELPRAPKGKTGWPWTSETMRPADQQLDESSWPRISVVTPTRNQGQFIEETIRSVLLQGYPNVEYIIIDGTSTDQTINVVERYADWLTYWISEPDRGQVHAINKGFERASGEIYAYLNSDDLYLPGALYAVARVAKTQPLGELLYGRCDLMREDDSHSIHRGRINSVYEALNVYEYWWNGSQFVQPEVFWRRSLATRVGSFDERYCLAFDYDYWARCFIAGATAVEVPYPLACFRFHADQKSSAAEQAAEEIRRILRHHLGDRPPISFWQKLKISASLEYDLYQYAKDPRGTGSRQSLPASLLRHPEWLLLKPVRERLYAACGRVLSSTRTAPQL